MFNRSFACLARPSLGRSVKLTNSWSERIGQQTKSFSRSPASLQFDKNDQFDKNKIYELSHYEMGKLSEQMDQGLQVQQSQRNQSNRKQHYQVGLTNDRRNQLNRLNRSDLELEPQEDDELSYKHPNTKAIRRDYIKTIQPELPPTFNLATYANHLDIIKQLVKLGVSIRRLEEDRETAKYLITLNFDKDVVPHLNFLIRCGLQKGDLGDFLTRNFKILQENLENLQKRFDYYKKMKFAPKQIVEMMLYYPKFINHPIEQVDAKLGYLQRYLKLKPVFVRKMLYNCPYILKTNKTHLEVSRYLAKFFFVFR